ncbi:MAG: peptidoglycan DD-metalloendopeptidase family protein [Cytophagales bacterium]|nr:peptidoglycan DD-metalloendopeptidase family protein [Cytophagales bacterium]
MTVNPYHIDGGKYKDSTLLVLYDSLKGNWSMPLKDHYVTSKFGQRGHRHHYGTDLRLSIGDTVRSVFDGIIRISKYNRGGYGHYVMVRHYNGTETIYGHLSKRIAKVGQHVKAGDVIGLGGNTGRSSGPHLHFEVRYQGNAIDPKHVWSFESDTIRSDTLLLTPKHYEYIRHARRAVYHRVRSGESLWTISRRYRVSIRQICRLNGITKRTVIRVGRRLRVR